MRKGWILVSIAIVFLATLVMNARAQKAAGAAKKNEPANRTFGIGERILGFDVAPQGLPDDGQQKLPEMAVQYPGNSMLNYRGVVLDNFNTYNTFYDEIVVDFGSTGVWAFELGFHWVQLSGLNPDWMISGNLIGENVLIAGFGSNGVWVWKTAHFMDSGSWTQISGAAASGAFVTDDDNDGQDEIYVDFDSLGLWRYDSSDLWAQASPLNPYLGLRMDTVVSGWEEACVLFPTYGVWRIHWYSGTPYYYQLTGTVTSQDDHASAKFIGGTAEDLVVDFGSLGLWLLKENDLSWHQIDPHNVSRVREVNFVGDSNAELLIRYNTAPTGLWMWDYSGFPGTLTQLHSWTPDATGFVEPFDSPNGQERIAVDFGANGLWLFDWTASGWTQLSPLDPDFMVAGRNTTNGKNQLVVSFGASGLWLYNGISGSWTQLSALSADYSN